MTKRHQALGREDQKRIEEELRRAYDFDPRDPLFGLSRPELSGPRLDRRTTLRLLAAVPMPDPVAERAREHQILPGEVPSPLNPPPGCVFHPRCRLAEPACRLRVPELLELRQDHWVACPVVAR